MFNKNLHIFLPTIIFFSIIIAGYFIRRIVINWLLNIAKNTETNIDDIIISAIKGPFIIWCVILSAYLALRFSQLSEKPLEIIGKLLGILTIISVTLVISNIISGAIKVYTHKIASAIPVTTFTENVARIVIFSISFLYILNILGIPIAPLLATLGVGGLAVALALQDTLTNLFAGFQIIINKQLKIGDYIKLNSGEEGYIIDINWRITKIRMLSNNVILIPNAKLTHSLITNYNLPDKDMAVLVNLGVHYNSDLNKVEEIVSSVGKEVMQTVTGGIPQFDPFIRYHTFGEFSINFTVILRGKEFVDQYLIKHEFIKQIHERFRHEGIVIPYPIRAVNYEQEKEGYTYQDVNRC